MILGIKTLEKLRLLINEETEYRSGPELVKFFNQLGFSDTYGQGFPSRWMYTDEKLAAINGTPELDKCIKNVLAPINFIDQMEVLDGHIASFNKYLAFDKWTIVRDNADLLFKKAEKVTIKPTQTRVEGEDEFLKREFGTVDISKIQLESAFTEILQYRIEEIEKCFAAESPLSVVLLAGSTLEGVFLGLANKYPKHFNTAYASPKDQNGKVRAFHEWNLNAFIDVGRELGLIQHDTSKFSHTLRDFRNYVHPFEQLASGFNPRTHTAKLCLQVLKAAIQEIGENIGKL